MLAGLNCHKQPSEKHDQFVLKIGSIHRAKSKNILYDNALGHFTMISHPPLLKLETDGRFTGILAEQFSYSNDYTIWKFKIRKNFYWSDGLPVKPEDIKFSLLYKGKHLPSRKWMGKLIKVIDIDQKGDIVCTLAKPYTRFDIEFTSVRILPRHIWKGIKNPERWESPRLYTGCGPFIIKDIDLNSGVVSMVRNPFWKGKSPQLDRIEIHMYHNPDVLSLALKRGDVDTYYKYADTFPYGNISSLRETGLYKIKKCTESGFIFLGFNLKKQPLDDHSLRQAIVYALDYQEIRKLITKGFGQIPQKGFVPPYFRFYHPTEPLVRDINKARKILEGSGYRDLNGDGILEDREKQPMKLRLVSTLIYTRLSELVKDYLNQIGIQVQLQILDPMTWIHTKDRYQYDLTISRTTPWGMMMHAGWSTGYFDYRRSGQGVLHIIDDPDYIHLCDAILSTKDPHQLKVLARKIQEYHAAHIPAVALISKTDVIPSKLNLSGWHHDPLFGIYNLSSFLRLKLTYADH